MLRAAVRLLLSERFRSQDLVDATHLGVALRHARPLRTSDDVSRLRPVRRRVATTIDFSAHGTLSYS